MEKNMRQWIQGVRESENRLAIPIMTHPGIDAIGKKINDAVTDGDVQFSAIKAIQDKYPMAAATMMMDLTVEAEAFGSRINFSNDEIPTVAARLVSDFPSVEALKIPSLDSARVPQYLKAVKLAAGNISDKPVLAGCIGPFSLAGRLFDLSEIMTAVYLEPDTIKLLLQKCSRFLNGYIREMKRLGANGILMAEPAAGLLSGELCDEFSSPFIRQIVEDVQDDHFLFILHNCGNKGQATQSMISTGARGLHFGNAINLVETLETVPSDVFVMGNLDPAGVFRMASSREVFDATTALLRQTAAHHNFIISSGCDIPPRVPRPNLDAFFDAVKKFNQEKSPRRASSYANRDILTEIR